MRRRLWSLVEPPRPATPATPSRAARPRRAQLRFQADAEAAAVGPRGRYGPLAAEQRVACAGRAPTRPSVRQLARPFRVGSVVALPAAASLAAMHGWLQAGLVLWGGAGDQASIHTPLLRAGPRLMRLRRLRVAVRFLSQALFLAVPR